MRKTIVIAILMLLGVSCNHQTSDYLLVKLHTGDSMRVNAERFERHLESHPNTLYESYCTSKLRVKCFDSTIRIGISHTITGKEQFSVLYMHFTEEEFYSEHPLFETIRAFECDSFTLVSNGNSYRK